MATNGNGVRDLGHRLLAAGFLYLVALEAAVAAPHQSADAATNYPEAIELPRFAVDKLIKLKTSKQLIAQSSGQPVDNHDASTNVDLAPYPGRDIPGASDDPRIISLAVFAVKEYNKEQGNNRLEFKKVVRASKHPRSFSLYYIELVAVEDGHDRMYGARVRERDWSNELLSFTPLDQ